MDHILLPTGPTPKKKTENPRIEPLKELFRHRRTLKRTLLDPQSAAHSPTAPQAPARVPTEPPELATKAARTAAPYERVYGIGFRVKSALGIYTSFRPHVADLVP